MSKKTVTTITITSDDKNTVLNKMAALATTNVTAGFTSGDMSKSDGKKVIWESK